MGFIKDFIISTSLTVIQLDIQNTRKIQIVSFIMRYHVFMWSVESSDMQFTASHLGTVTNITVF